MMGEPIESLRQGVKALLADLRSDPQALETVWLSVITFGSGAGQTTPLTEIGGFQEPELSASGCTDFGRSLTVLSEAIAADVLQNTATQKGDYKPLVFIMTDGQPTDRWEEPATKLRDSRAATIVGCAVGPNADERPLLFLTESVVRMNNLQPDQFKAFFRWVSASVRMSSLRMGDAPLPPPPSGITLIQ
jgi:uncharacterized protein YegL